MKADPLCVAYVLRHSYTKGTYLQHLRTRSDIADQRCQMCGKAFKFRCSLHKHPAKYEEHAKYMYQCETCEKKIIWPEKVFGSTRKNTQ